MSKSDLLKEKTKARMIKNAAQLWGVDNADIELNFDPIIAILIEGCVNEIEKIGHEIHNTHAKVINRLAQLLTPDVLTGSLPAHAIIHAIPNEPKTLLTTEAQFYTTKKAPSESNPNVEVNSDVFFAPVSPVKIINGTLKFFAFQDRAYELTNIYQKNLIATAEGDTELEKNTLWLGMELNSSIQDLDELIFYFDLKNSPYRDSFLNLLPSAQFSIDGVVIPSEMGFTAKKKITTLHPDDEFNPDRRTETEISTIYERNFRRIAGSTRDLVNIQSKRKKYPEIFPTVFSEKDLQKITGSFLWIKVEFAASVTGQMLMDIYCNTNCFPVVNKKHNEITFRLSKTMDIVPLQTSDYFFSVKKVSASDGYEYSNSPLSHEHHYSTGTYALRQGGIERFDKRNAMEMINYLLDLLRDESAAFSTLGNDFLSGNLKQLNQQLATLEQRAGRQAQSEEPSFYLMVNPRTTNENLFVGYWTTNGAFGNNIKAGNRLNLYSDGDVQSGSIVFLTTTTGGRNRIEETKRLGAFKQSLISRGRVVTEQDMKMFCMQEAPESISDIEIRKGFVISDDPKQGFIQTIDVILKVSQQTKMTASEWKDQCGVIAYKLKKTSSATSPIRVMTEPIAQPSDN